MVANLTVLYDDACGFCTRCRGWLSMQPQFVALDFVAAGSPDAARRFPSLRHTGDELTVVDDEGGVYRGADAFIMCLWALAEYRELADELAFPLLKPLARATFALVSASRGWISRLLGLGSQAEMADAIQTAQDSCDGG
jgi:predicted DCC family thiol-disulfide oxidoreductase YuxK